jgi:hypothetical protein
MPGLGSCDDPKPWRKSWPLWSIQSLISNSWPASYFFFCGANINMQFTQRVYLTWHITDDNTEVQRECWLLQDKTLRVLACIWQCSTTATRRDIHTLRKANAQTAVLHYVDRLSITWIDPNVLMPKRNRMDRGRKPIMEVLRQLGLFKNFWKGSLLREEEFRGYRTGAHPKRGCRTAAPPLKPPKPKFEKHRFCRHDDSIPLGRASSTRNSRATCCPQHTLMLIRNGAARSDLWFSILRNFSVYLLTKRQISSFWASRHLPCHLPTSPLPAL